MQNSALCFSVCGIITTSELPVLISEIQKKYNLKFNEKVKIFNSENYVNIFPVTIKHFPKKINICCNFRKYLILSKFCKILSLERCKGF